MTLKLFCLLGLGLYAALSISDFTLTFSLIEKKGTGAFEANPLAAIWLEEHGWTGLAVYKLGTCLVVLGAVALLVRRRPKVAAGVVAFGCGVLFTVTTYSERLMERTTKSQVLIDAQGRAPSEPSLAPLANLLDGE